MLVPSHDITVIIFMLVFSSVSVMKVILRILTECKSIHRSHIRIFVSLSVLCV